MSDLRVSVLDRAARAQVSPQQSSHGPRSRWLRQLAISLAIVLAGGAALAQSVTVKDVRIGRLGDRWLDTQRFQRIERATENKEHGYAVTYRIAGHGTVRLFWPRRSIDLGGDFAGASQRNRFAAMTLRTGRLWYPRVVTADTLPTVHRGILELDAMYARDARREMVVFDGLAGIAALGASMPGLRALPARPVRGGSGRMSASSTTSSSVPPTRGSGSGVSAGSKGTVAGTSTAAASTSARASAQALARALEAAGHSRPPGAAAHHIVAGNARLADPARKILRKLGIGINEASNGVFLPATRTSPNPTGAAVHSTLHTRVYYRQVNRRLGSATTRAQAERILAEIRQILLDGGF